MIIYRCFKGHGHTNKKDGLTSIFTSGRLNIRLDHSIFKYHASIRIIKL